MPALSAGLIQKPDIGKHHAAVNRLAHVVNREKTDLDCRKRFHFDPGLAIGLAGHTADNAGGFRMQIELSADMRKRQRVAERNEFGGFFCSP